MQKTNAETLEIIQSKAAVLGQYRDMLSGAFKELEAELQAVRNEHEANIKQLVRTVIRRQEELTQLIKDNPRLFEKPRTQIVDNIKFGLQKQKGKLSWINETALIRRIDEYTRQGQIKPDVASLIIRTERKLVAAALNELDAKLLKRLGVTVGADTDAVLIKSVDSHVEKAINQLLKTAQSDGGKL